MFLFFRITVDSTEYLVASITQRSNSQLIWRLGKSDGSILEYGGGIAQIYKTDDWIELRMSLDLLNNKALMASTFQQDLYFDAPMPPSVAFNNAWTFDESTKIYFGGAPGEPRMASIIPLQITVWNGYLPEAISAVTNKKLPGVFLLGHTRILRSFGDWNIHF